MSIGTRRGCRQGTEGLGTAQPPFRPASQPLPFCPRSIQMISYAFNCCSLTANWVSVSACSWLGPRSNAGLMDCFDAALHPEWLPDLSAFGSVHGMLVGPHRMRFAVCQRSFFSWSTISSCCLYGMVNKPLKGLRKAASIRHGISLSSHASKVAIEGLEC